MIGCDFLYVKKEKKKKTNICARSSLPHQGSFQTLPNPSPGLG